MAKTYYLRSTVDPTGVHAADIERALGTTAGSSTATVSSILGVNASTADADITFGLRTAGSAAGHFARVNSGLTSDLETTTQAEALFSGTGVKTATVSWDPSAGSSTDRFECLIAATRAASHGNQTLSIDVDNPSADATNGGIADGPWVGATDTPKTVNYIVTASQTNTENVGTIRGYVATVSETNNTEVGKILGYVALATQSNTTNASKTLNYVSTVTQSVVTALSHGLIKNYIVNITQTNNENVGKVSNYVSLVTQTNIENISSTHNYTTIVSQSNTENISKTRGYIVTVISTVGTQFNPGEGPTAYSAFRKKVFAYDKSGTFRAYSYRYARNELIFFVTSTDTPKTLNYTVNVSQTNTENTSKTIGYTSTVSQTNIENVSTSKNYVATTTESNTTDVGKIRAYVSTVSQTVTDTENRAKTLNYNVNATQSNTENVGKTSSYLATATSTVTTMVGKTRGYVVLVSQSVSTLVSQNVVKNYIVNVSQTNTENATFSTS